MKFTPPPVSLRQLQYLVAVDDTRNFRRAALLCRVSQPSLSSQIAEAEAALGLRVFERDRRRVLLTAAGEEIVQRARELLMAAEDLHAAAVRYADPLSGTLRIGVIPTVSPYLVPDVAPLLRRSFPRLQIHWTEDRTASLLLRLQAGELDAALIARESRLAELECMEIARDDFVLAMPNGHPLSRARRPVRSDELAGVDLLVLTEGHCLRDQALAACKRAHVSEYGATSLHTLVQMVASGEGVTLLPTLALESENRRATLSIRPFTKDGPGRTLVLAWRRGAPTEEALRAAAAVMRRIAKP